MRLLSDDDKALLVLEHLGPAALAGDKMSLYDCFYLALDVAEPAILAKLASAELPPLPEPSEMDGARWGYTADDMQSHAANAFAQGAASQLSAEPFTHYRYYDEQVQPFADEGTIPLFTLKEPK